LPYLPAAGRTVRRSPAPEGIAHSRRLRFARSDAEPVALHATGRPGERRRVSRAPGLTATLGSWRFAVSLANLFRNEPDIVVHSPGDVIIKTGEPGDAMYVILEGDVDIRLGNTSIDVAGRNEIIGEMAMVDQTGRSASVHALTPVRLARIDRRRFLYLIQNTPSFAIDVMTVMASRIRRLDAGAAAPPP
jgi:CRP/FNR family cyclic AMP-dependent transcriptional regulator